MKLEPKTSFNRIAIKAITWAWPGNIKRHNCYLSLHE